MRAASRKTDGTKSAEPDGERVKPERKNSSSHRLLIITAAVLFVLFLAIAGFILLVFTDRETEHQRRVAIVALLRPPAPLKEKTPPPTKEKPPEPQKETIVPPRTVEPLRKGGNPKGDNKPAPEGPLGVEGEGGPGSDAFGLVGRGKGGRDITSLGTGPAGTIGGDRDRASVMRKYGGYYRLIQDEMQRAVTKRLEGNRAIPKGRLEILVWVSVDDRGAVSEFRITRSSGNEAMDEAVKEYLSYASIQVPPLGMPRDMSIRFVY
jgi:outer membrane biosynthesis protein TonB